MGPILAGRSLNRLREMGAPLHLLSEQHALFSDGENWVHTNPRCNAVRTTERAHFTPDWAAVAEVSWHPCTRCLNGDPAWLSAAYGYGEALSDDSGMTVGRGLLAGRGQRRRLDLAASVLARSHARTLFSSHRSPTGRVDPRVQAWADQRLVEATAELAADRAEFARQWRQRPKSTGASRLMLFTSISKVINQATDAPAALLYARRSFVIGEPVVAHPDAHWLVVRAPTPAVAPAAETSSAQQWLRDLGPATARDANPALWAAFTAIYAQGHTTVAADALDAARAVVR